MVERITLESNSESLDNLEEQLRKEAELAGYETGLELGKKAGQDEGYSQGLVEGANIGAEVGFYRGYTITWIHMLQSDTLTIPKSAKVLNKLKECLELVDSIPKTNETICEEILSKVRVKFKQSTSLLNLKP